MKECKKQKEKKTGYSFKLEENSKCNKKNVRRVKEKKKEEIIIFLNLYNILIFYAFFVL